MRRTSGFTLIEVLLSMLIFMAGVTGIYSLFSTALGMQRAGTETADLTRRLDELVWQLEQELGQGLHWDEDRGAWRDVESAAFGEGLFYSCRFSPEIGNEHAGTLVATIALARSEAGLAGAEAVSYVLTPGPTPAAAVRAVRQRKRRP
jgi:hypothetical protein